MNLPLTPSRIAAVYECLREFPPFSRWRLPRASDIVFEVTKHRDRSADCESPAKGSAWSLRVSAAKHGHLTTLMMSVAHEMVHLGLHSQGSPNWGTHGPEFQRAAHLVCKRFGWDARTF